AGSGQLPGAHQHDVTPADPCRDALGGDRRGQVVGGDSEPIRQLPVGAEGAADVQQHTPSGDQVGDGLDAGDPVALTGDDVRGVAAVPGLTVVEDVAEAVPLRLALQRH